MSIFQQDLDPMDTPFFLGGEAFFFCGNMEVTVIFECLKKRLSLSL